VFSAVLNNISLNNYGDRVYLWGKLVYKGEIQSHNVLLGAPRN